MNTTRPYFPSGIGRPILGCYTYGFPNPSISVITLEVIVKWRSYHFIGLLPPV